MNDQDWNHQDKDPWEYEDKSAENPSDTGSQPTTETDAEQPQPESPAQDGDAPQQENPNPSPDAANPDSQNPTQPQNQNQPYENPQNPGQQQNQGYPYGSPYRNPQNNGPYAPYGQYGSPYGQYQNPGGYGRYDNPYSPPNGQQPYWNAYGQTPPPPHKMNGGLKVFLWFLGIVTVGLLAAFVYLSVQPSFRNQLPSASSSESSSSSSSASSGFNGTVPGSSSASSGTGSVIGGVQGNGTDPNSSGITMESKPSGSALQASEVYKKLIQSVVGVETTISADSTTTGQSETGEGTGIVATSDGYILTNAHVVNYSRDNVVKVVMHDNQQYQAKVVGYDKTSDLAVLKINATGLSPATFGDVNQMSIGDQVLAIGNPGGLSFAGSLTGGMISALNRSIESHSENGMTYIQTDAAINPGNSGGPLVNMYGQVIGINSNKIAATGYEGMGFAIPISKAQPVINQLIKNGYVSGRCRLGITGQDVQSAQADLLGYPQGVVIKAISPDSDMGRAGAKVGDIITAAGGKKIGSLDDLYSVLDTHKPGDVISMTLTTGANSTGNGSTKTIQVKLLEDKGQTQK